MGNTWTLQSGVYHQKVAIGPTNQFMVAIQNNGDPDATVVYSRDFGVTWTASTGITGNANCISSNGSTVIVGVNSVASHLYVSTDYGTTFESLGNSPVSYWTVVGMMVAEMRGVVAADEAAVSRLIDDVVVRSRKRANDVAFAEVA